MPFLDKGYSVNFSSTTGLIPSFGFYLDANSKPEGAKKVMERFAASFDLFVKQGNTQSKIPNLLTNEKNSNGYTLKINVDKLPKEQLQNLPSEFTQRPLELSYGVNNNNLAFITFNSPSETSKQTLSENKEYIAAKTLLKEFDQGILFINFDPLLKYINQIVQFANSYSPDEVSKSNIKDYEIFASYMKPIKSITISSKKATTSDNEAEGFIHIGQ